MRLLSGTTLLAMGTWLVLTGGLTAAGQDTGRRLNSAQSVWDRVIEAKGGRERLHDVRTLEITSRQRVARSRPHRSLYSRHTELVIDVRGRAWEWSDYRDDPPSRDPGVKFNVRLSDATRGRIWGAMNGGRARFSEIDPVWTIRETVLLYLFETRDFQPEVVSATTAGRNRIRLEMKAPGFARITYVVDSRAWRPVEVTTVPLIRSTWDGSNALVEAFPRRHVLSGAAESSGLVMPTKVDGMTVTVAVNPDVDARLFGTPPDRITRWDAWKNPGDRPDLPGAPIVGQFHSTLPDYALMIPAGLAGTNYVEQQGFEVALPRGEGTVLVQSEWLSSSVDKAVDDLAKQAVARHPKLEIGTRSRIQIGGFEAIDVTLVDASGSGDINYVRLAVVVRQEAQVSIELDQPAASIEGARVFGALADSLHFGHK